MLQEYDLMTERAEVAHPTLAIICQTSSESKPNRHSRMAHSLWRSHCITERFQVRRACSGSSNDHGVQPLGIRLIER